MSVNRPSVAAPRAGGFILPVVLLVSGGIARLTVAAYERVIVGSRAAAAVYDGAVAFHAADSALLGCMRRGLDGAQGLTKAMSQTKQGGTTEAMFRAEQGSATEAVSQVEEGGAAGASQCAIVQCPSGLAEQPAYRLTVTASGAMPGTRASVHALATFAGGRWRWRWSARAVACPEDRR